MRLLVIEDNPKMARLIRQGLAEQSYAVDIATRGEEGEFLALSEPYDAIVLDLMLPDQDGLQLCRNLRRRGVKTPILMLTALSTTADKVSGLDAGADDYLTKPFEFAELSARIRSLLRRGQATEASTLAFWDLEMDLLARRVTRSGQRIKLTPKEFALLEYFMRSPNRLLTRSAIGEHVWDMNFSPDSNVIDVYVHTLRRKIDRGHERPLIHTVIGAGYMLSAERPD
jgi:DNA-binding response OmpR family regulator